jgi:hypothetical protein
MKLKPEFSKILKKALSDLTTGVFLFDIWWGLAWQEIIQRYARSIIGPFWLTLSQYLTEKRNEMESLNTFNREEDGVNQSTKKNLPIQDKIANWIYLCFIKYWIFLSSVIK